MSVNPISAACSRSNPAKPSRGFGKRVTRTCFVFVLAAGSNLAFATAAQAAEYYVATTGSDSNAGTMAQPFATLQKAVNVVAAGDTVWIRGGVYNIVTPATSGAGINITKSGTSDTNRIKFWAYPGELPIFDFSKMVISTTGYTSGFSVSGSWLHFKGFEVRNVPMNTRSNTGFGVGDPAHDDIFEQLDGWASHAYPLGPFVDHPGRQLFKIDDVRPEATARRQPPPGIHNRGVNGYEWELWKLQQLGVSKDLPVYVTESGWRHARSQHPNARDKDFATVEDGRFADLVSLTFDGPTNGPAEGWIPWNHDPRVRAAALFALAGRPDHWGHTNLLLVDDEGRIQGVYPFAEVLSQVSPGVVAAGR